MKKKKRIILIISIILAITIILTTVFLYLKKKESLSNFNSTANNTTSGKINDNKEKKEEFYSVLDHLPDFSKEQKDPSKILWSTGVPLNKNPLKYNNGKCVNGIWWYDSVGKEIEISPEEIATIKLNTKNKVLDSLGKNSDEKSASHCRILTENGMYVPIGFEFNDSRDASWNYRYFENANFSFGEIFENKLYTSKIFLFDLDESTEKMSIEEKLKYCYNYFGNPSGLYWINPINWLWKSSKQPYENFESLKNAERNIKDAGTKSYSLVWDYGDCYVVANLCDNENVSKETSLLELVLYQKVTIKEALGGPVKQFSSYKDIKDGYIGYGYAPAQIRLVEDDLAPTE